MNIIMKSLEKRDDGTPFYKEFCVIEKVRKLSKKEDGCRVFEVVIKELSGGTRYTCTVGCNEVHALFGMHSARMKIVSTPVSVKLEFSLKEQRDGKLYFELEEPPR